jgi:hypothetical protein
MHRFLALLVTACSLLSPAAAADPSPVLQIDFEDQARYSLSAGELSAEQPIAGLRSLRVDARDQTEEWFEFFTTEAGALPPGFLYTASVRYRVLAAEPDSEFYLLFRSEGKGWGRYDRGWQKQRLSVGAEGTLSTSVGLDNRSDYELMLGLHGRAEILIDEIVISAGEAFHEASSDETFQASIPESAERIALLDFESDPLPGRLTGFGAIDAAAPLSGTRSLLGDSSASEQDWNIFFESERGWFNPDHRYSLTLSYQLLSADRHSELYLLIRSPQGHAYDVLLQTWKLAPGASGSLNVKTAVYWPHADYSLALGLKGRGTLRIDDLSVVEEVRPPNTALLERPAFDPARAKLVWEETFDGERLDPERWQIEGDSRRRGGMWRQRNCFLDGEGQLVMRFDRSDGTYNGGCITSKPKFRYGYFEARIKFNQHPGHWLGFWLMDGAVNKVGNDGRDGTEIDIVESPWRGTDTASHALHWDGYGEDHRSLGRHVAVPGLDEGYHTFGVDWFEHGYVFYVNGTETWRSYAGEVCQVPLSILISDELGGWSGKPVDALLPDDSHVDYVRVWQYPGEGEVVPAD